MNSKGTHFNFLMTPLGTSEDGRTVRSFINDAFDSVRDKLNTLKENNQVVHVVYPFDQRLNTWDFFAKKVVGNEVNDYLVEKINKGEGSMGMIINDKALYNNLENSSSSLDSLLKDFKENPGRYIQFSVFGGGKKKKKKKEKKKKWG